MVTLRTGEPQFNVIMGVHKPDGTLTWISISSCPMLGSDGKPSAVVATFNDITKQKLLPDALRRPDEQFAQGFQASPIIMTLAEVDSTGTVRIVNVNEAFERQTGYRRSEAISRTVQELGLWDDEAALEAAVQQFRPRV